MLIALDTETGLCECGCGTIIPYLTKKGKRRRFAKNHHRIGKYPTGPDHPNFVGVYYNHNGYRMFWVGRDHPMSDVRGYCMEHRLVMAQGLGRMLTKGEVVHHINEIKLDNRF